MFLNGWARVGEKGKGMFRAWKLERRCGMTGLIGHGCGLEG